MSSLLLVLLSFWSPTDPFNGWETLEKLSITMSYDEFLGEEMEVPVFSEELKAFDGKEVLITGYVIPLEASGAQDYFVLSRFPFSNCFFCGNAGAETVVEVYTNESFDVRDTKVRVKGTLKLNDNDPMHLFFILEDATAEFIDN